MSDIAAELAKLHTLKGADYSRQVERIARMGNFHPVDGEMDVFSTGSEGENDYSNLLKRNFAFQKDFVMKFRKEFGK